MREPESATASRPPSGPDPARAADGREASHPAEPNESGPAAPKEPAAPEEPPAQEEQTLPEGGSPGGTPSESGGPSDSEGPQLARPDPGERAAYDELWLNLQEALGRRVQPEQFETWFRRANLMRVDDHEVEIAVQNKFARNWLQNYYLETLEQAVHAVLGVKRKIRLTVDPELAVPPGTRPAGHPGAGPAGSRAGSRDEVRVEGRDAPQPTAPGSRSPFDRDARRGALDGNTAAASPPHSGGAGLPPGGPDSGGSSIGGPGIAGPGIAGPGAPATRVLRAEGGLLWNSDVVLNSKYTFENFVVGPCNRFGHAAAMGAGEQPGKHYNPFFLHGRVGVGKTHLLQAVCFSILSRWPEARILYLSCETFVNHFIAALENGDLTEFRNKYRQVDVLVVDDIHLLANKERTQEEFFHTFNTLYNAGKQIVLSSDSPPKDIPTLQDRLVSRFKWGMVTEIEPPCYETRMAIVKRKSRDRGTDVPDDVAQLIAEQIDENVRELEGAVTRLIGYSSLTGKPITLELAREGLADLLHVRRGAPSMDDIIQDVTQHFGVKLSELQSKKRTKSIAYPRQVAMYLARKVTRHSLEEIGGWFGGRDHSTVLYAVDRIGTRMTTDEVCRQSVEDLLGRLQGGRSS
jgi:chromosomal replication initiator protein